MEEKTLVLLKPDALVKSLTGDILSMISETKLKIVGAKVVKITREFAKKHYSELAPNLKKKFGEEKGQEVFENVLDYIQGKYHTDRILALVYKGDKAIKKIRDIAGETNPEKAHPISIRGKYGRLHSQTQVMENVVHCSADLDSASREINLWFNSK